MQERTVVARAAALAAGLWIVAAGPAWAAHRGYCALTLNGSALEGDVSMAFVGGEDVSSDHIEIHELHHLVTRQDGHGGGTAHEKLIMTKVLDKASPLLAQALDQNQLVEGSCKFFRNDPQTGEVVKFYSIAITGGRVVAIEPLLPDVFDADLAARPMQERVRFIYQTISFTSETGSTQYTMSVAP